MSDPPCNVLIVAGGHDTRAAPVAHAVEGGARLHLLRDHLAAVAELAAGFASAFTDPAWGRAAGRLHDVGKFAAGFQKMIAEASGYEAHIEGDAAGPRDHSSAGAVRAMEGLADTRGLALALLVAGHHGGLPDAGDLLKRRLPEKRRDRCLERAEEGGARPDDLRMEVPALPEGLADPRAQESVRRFEMWVRMLFSCLCDADFLDTAAFFDPARSVARQPSMEELATKLGAHLVRLVAVKADSEVNRVRAEVLAHCRSTARMPPGFFSLTVPTGGGKTLSSMAFALEHAREHALRRVVVGIPFTSIIEQNAGAYRDALGADAVLEHHSALAQERDTGARRLAAENWDAPIVVTTTVQLFEGLFANRPAACRKLHRLARSVVVLDEAQTLPPGLLAPLLDGLRCLVRDFGATVVICTATQPALGTDRLEVGLEGVREIVPSPARAFARLRRVRVRWPAEEEPVSWERLAQEIAAEPDVLAIVHRRKDARDLCRLLDERAGEGTTVHLSALMCAEHRTRVLAEIAARKRSGHPVRLVATQLVEAGVDLDFAVVYRALGGLDSMAQAAGRCNREGRLPGLGELRVFRAPTSPPRGVPATGLAVASGMLAADPALDLFEPAVYGRYFELLYGTRDLDAKRIQALREKLDFPEVAARFRLIEDDWSAPVVVPYGQAADHLAHLERSGGREALRRLQRFSVAVPARDRESWLASGGAREVGGLAVAVLGSSVYDDRFGLLLDRVGKVDPESLIA